jgi:hypothetical protein
MILLAPDSWLLTPDSWLLTPEISPSSHIDEKDFLNDTDGNRPRIFWPCK